MSVLNNSMPKKIIFTAVLLIFSLYSCDNSSAWMDDEKKELIAACIKAGKDKVPDTSKIKDICECSINKFASAFNLEEYQQIQTQEILTIDLNNRLNLVVESIAQDCDIFYDSSTSFK